MVASASKIHVIKTEKAILHILTILSTTFGETLLQKRIQTNSLNQQLFQDLDIYQGKDALKSSETPF